MNKSLLVTLAMLLTAASGAWADAGYTGIKLTFTRADAGSGTATDAVSDVTVNVTDKDGNAIAGVSATLASTTITQLKTGSAAALSRTSNAVLAPNAGYANNQNSTIEYTFCVTGLSTEFTYNYAALDVYALTSGGAAQGNTGNTVREWTFDVLTGSTSDGVSSFVSQAGNDICTVTNSDGGLYHKTWEMAASNENATATLYIKVVLKKTDSNGCYAGLGSVQLYYVAPAVVISDLNNLSNAKSYSLSTPRGTLGVNGSTFVSTAKDFTASEFAIVSYGGAYYLYSVAAKKFVTSEGALAYTVTSSSALTFEDLGSSNFKLKLGSSNYINVSSGYDAGLVVDAHSTTDEGNTFTITEASDFDATDALAALKWVEYDEENAAGEIAYSAGLGTYTKTNGGAYASEWVSNITAPQLTLLTDVNNIVIADGGLHTQTYKLSVPAGYRITGYSFTATPSTGTTGMSVTPAGSSAINIPAGGTAVDVTGLNAQTTTFDVSGAYVRVSNFKVTYTIATIAYITDLASLENGKAYIVTNARAAWQVASASATAFSANASVNPKTDRGNTALQIAIIKQGEAYYLYSVNAGKYLTAANSLYASPLDSVTITEATYTGAPDNHKWFFSFDSSHNINVNSVPDFGTGTWSTKDAGNVCAIIEAADFDNTAALAAFTNYGQRVADYATYKGYMTDFVHSYQSEIGYPKTTSTGYTNLASILTEASVFTEDDYNNLPTYYAAYLAETDINTPSAGFYRIYHAVTSGGTKKYLTDTGSALVATTSVDDAKKSVFYWDGSTLVAYNGGYYINQVSRSLTAATFTFTKSNQGTFGQMNVNPSTGSPWYVQDDTADYTLNRWSKGNQVGSNFQVEAVTSLPVTFAGQYASLYSPVDLTIPDGVKAYTGELNAAGTRFNLTELSGTIPHNTGVILELEDDFASMDDADKTKTFAIANTTTDGTSDLSGKIAATTVSASSVLVLGKSDNNWGLYTYSGTELGGFKAYMDMPSSGVKGFAFSFGTPTAISDTQVAGSLNGAAYNLAGQRVAKPSRGLYIVGGRKMVVR